LISSFYGISEINPILESDEYVSFAWPSWAAEQILGLGATLIAGQKLNFPETSETVPIDISEVAPHTVLFSSRLWEGTASTIQRKIETGSRLNRAICELFIRVGFRVGALKAQGKKPNLFWRLLAVLANLLVFRPLKSKHGLHRVKSAYTSGATLSPDLIRFYAAIGIDLKQLFCLAETSIIAAQAKGTVNPGIVGKPLLNVSITVSEQGEILVDRDNCFLGYHKDPDATEKVFNGGWFHTGDAGYIDADGYLVYIDKLADIRQLSDRIRFSPQTIESMLRFSPAIMDAIAYIGDERDYIGAIITVDAEYITKWAEKADIRHCTFVDLVQRSTIRELICDEIRKVNNLLANQTRIKGFIILDKPFDPDGGGFTRTMKVRRSFVLDRYHELAEAIFDGRESVEVESLVVYKDGSQVTLPTRILVNRVD